MSANGSTTISRGYWTIYDSYSVAKDRQCIDLHCDDEEGEHTLLELTIPEAKELANALLAMALVKNKEADATPQK